jgi:O-antigen/teichoic acid export membrane protein
VLPGAFIASYYPVVSTYYKHSKDKLHTVFESAFFYMMILSFPISVGVIVLGDDIIQTVWDDVWRASVQPLWILMLALPFIFFNYPVGNFLNAVDRQKLNTLNMCIALAVNIALNSVLIPLYTFNGAAIAALASSIVLVLLGIPWVYKVAKFDIGYIVKKIILVGLAAGTMGFILFMVQENYHILVLIPLGAIIYAALLLALGAVTPQELSKLKASLLKRS